MDYPENHAPRDRSQYIEDRACKLMNSGKYDPADFDNLHEAFLLAGNSREEMDLLADYIDTKDFEKLGRLIYVWSFDYAEAAAERQASEEWESGRTDPWLT